MATRGFVERGCGLALAGVLMLLLATVIGPAGPAEATTTPAPSTGPEYSATGVCVSGVPEFAFTFSGFAVGQNTSVDLYLYDSPDATGSEATTVGPSGTATVLWNTDSPDFGPGPHVVAVHTGSNGIPAVNLDPVPDWPIANSYSATLPHCGAAVSSFVAIAKTPDDRGYWQVTADGQVLAFGDARWFGSMSGAQLSHSIVGIAATPRGNGYWLVGSDGGVFSFGDAQFYGSTGGITLNRPVVGIASTLDGAGYYLVASDGGIFSFGDAQFLGSMGGVHLNAPVVGMDVDASTGGYWLVASDGGVFSFGAPFLGSTGSLHLNRPVVGMESTIGDGYLFVASDGGVFTFGVSGFFGSLGSMPPAHSIVGIAGTTAGQGYTILDSEGGIYPYGNASNFGSIYGAATLT